MDISLLRQIIQGGLDKLKEADALVSKLIDEGVAASKIIREVISAPMGKIFAE
jgi:hypothetical protein